MAQIDYTTLVTSEYQRSPYFLALVDALCNQGVNAACVDAIPAAFDLDNAEGAQLDIVGQWVGVSRVVSEILLVGYFGFADDEAALPFGENGNPSIGGRFYEDGEDFEGSTVLSDAEYLTIINAKIIRNQYDGGQAELEAAMFDLFGVPAIVNDAGNLSLNIVVQGQITQTQQALISTYDLLPRPGGVAIGSVGYLSPVPVPTLTALELTPTEALLTASYAGPPTAASYAYQLSQVSAEGPWVRTPGTLVSEAVIDLVPNATYWFQVQVKTTEFPPRTSPWSVPVSLTMSV